MINRPNTKAQRLHRHKRVRGKVSGTPERPEQNQIVRFLDWKVSAINRLISIKRKQIALLHERQI